MTSAHVTAVESPLAIPRLHVVTDTRSGRDPLPVVVAALSASASHGMPIAVQVRHKTCTDRELLDLTRRVVALARPQGALVVVDDRLDVALAADAGGVHLGAHDLPVRDAVRWAGTHVAVGGTCRNAQDALIAEQAGAAYVGVGPVFATTTKSGLPDPLGPGGLQAATLGTRLPVIAIGGVTAAAVPELLATGAHGVAVVAAVSGAADPQAATTRLLQALEGHR